MLRLVRLLTFIKGVPQLQVIVSGLVTGLKSVTYIVMLLLLMIYMCAILACLFFGANDPGRFGSVAMSMLSLFQVSTLASWSSVAYTSWWGCENFLKDPYSPDHPSMIHTMFGDFEGYRCDMDQAHPITSLFFFPLYIVLTAWVIMSLFIGAITMVWAHAVLISNCKLRFSHFVSFYKQTCTSIVATTARSPGHVRGF
jgi:hypothetical protein